MDKKIILLNNALTSSIDQSTSLDLASGKMGFCIYFYILSDYQKNEYQKIAESLLDDIFNSIDSVNSIDLRYGLAGIGLGIRYLINKKYIHGNVNNVLKDIDDKVFKSLCNPTLIDSCDPLFLIYQLYYISVRLEDQQTESESELLFQELAIQTINQLYNKINIPFFREPINYTFDYALPLFLFVLSGIHPLIPYQGKIKKILDEYSYEVLSMYPKLNVNRLYLWCGMNRITVYYKNDAWIKHTALLQRDINFKNIISHELKNRNIFFADGLGSVLFLINEYGQQTETDELENNKKDIIQKINAADVWDLMLNDSAYFNKSKGLYTGICGALLAFKHFNLVQLV